MYTLYHHFVEKVKQEEIQRYNNKHREYLIRSGKLKVQQKRSQRNMIENQRQIKPNSMGNQNKDQNTMHINNSASNEQKPRRQRQFNRPTKNSQKTEPQNTMTNNYSNTSKVLPNQRSSNNSRVINNNYEKVYAKQEGNQVNQSMHQNDRPIKQNKLTQQQIQYLNEGRHNNKAKGTINNQVKQQVQLGYRLEEKSGSSNNAVANNQQPNQFQEVELVQCQMCGRKFKEAVLAKHEKICQKVFQQKRKPFEVKATDEQAQLLKKKSTMSNKDNENNDKKEAKWKKQSQIFQNMIKQGRGEKVQIIQADDRIQCPGCGRKFNEKAASRHIQFCTKKKKK